MQFSVILSKCSFLWYFFKNNIPLPAVYLPPLVLYLLDRREGLCKDSVGGEAANGAFRLRRWENECFLYLALLSFKDEFCLPFSELHAEPAGKNETVSVFGKK